MTSFEQLDTLKRQVEEDFKLDLAAIDRLQRRFLDARGFGSAPKVTLVPVEKPVSHEGNGEPLPQLLEARPLRPEPDDLTDAARTMFSNFR